MNSTDTESKAVIKAGVQELEPFVEKGFLTSEGVLKAFALGWELGTNEGSGNVRERVRAWVQFVLCNGSPSIRVSMRTLRSMVRKGVIHKIQSSPDDRYWLFRYGLV